MFTGIQEMAVFYVFIYHILIMGPSRNTVFKAKSNTTSSLDPSSFLSSEDKTHTYAFSSKENGSTIMGSWAVYLSSVEGWITCQIRGKERKQNMVLLQVPSNKLGEKNLKSK